MARLLRQCLSRYQDTQRGKHRCRITWSSTVTAKVAWERNNVSKY